MEAAALIQTHAELLQALNQRLDRGEQEYGGRSFVRPVGETERQILEEALDEPGWCFILWAQAMRKAGMRDPRQLRDAFFANVRHRLETNDRGSMANQGTDAASCAAKVEILVLDLVEHFFALQRRLGPIARAIEVAEAWRPHVSPRSQARSRFTRSDD